jgi:hypothetical protein
MQSNIAIIFKETKDWAEIKLNAKLLDRKIYNLTKSLPLQQSSS